MPNTRYRKDWKYSYKLIKLWFDQNYNVPSVGQAWKILSSVIKPVKTPDLKQNRGQM
jgi:hypothetical protein